jgi:uncharacterized membrane protein YdjX (TVP38/TMEM64 family)
MSKGHAVLSNFEPVELPKSKNRVLRLLPVAIIVAGLGLGYASGLQDYLSLSYLGESRLWLKAYVGDNYLISAAVFMILYALAVAFSLPAASVLTIFGGFLFGWLAGGAMVAVSATVGATILFLAARSAFGDFLREKVGGRAADLAEGFKRDAFSYLLVLRLAPVVPFFLLNIAPALFNISLRSYVSATFLGILPGTFAFAFLGQGVDSVIDAAQKVGKQASVGDLVTPQITLAFAALACVATIPIIIKKLRKAPAEKTI